MARYIALMLLSVICFFMPLSQVKGHGRLIEPPSRASMWRYGFNTPPNYNDHELYCGGYSRQWSKNKGQCGVCGDAWDMPEPRPHEQGGKYGLGVITRRYDPGSNITVRIDLTANHQGYFEFRLCPRESPEGKEIDQKCLDQYILQRSDGKGARYYPGEYGNKVIEMRYKLPEELECYQCVFQWRYIAGNNWGDCGNGTGAVGCGTQEEFRACSDVSIGKGLPPTRLTTPTPPRIRTTTTRTRISTTTSTEVYHDSSTYSPTEEEIEVEEAMWWILLLVALLTLFASLMVIAILYWYYYHASDNVKHVLQARSLHDKVFIPPPITVVTAPKQQAPQPPMPLNPPPVPPRRVKRNSLSESNLQNVD